MKSTGEGTRILNCIIDTFLVLLVAMVLMRIWNWYVFYWGFMPLNFGWFFFGFLFLYYFVWEWLTGRTPGKMISMSRVVNEQGRRPGIGAIFIRSAVRLFIPDLFFLPFLGMTLHDYLSKTRVVRFE